jgi:hypothetical protein
MQPRWHKGSILLTCGGKIDPQRADGVGATWVGFDGEEVLSWWFSDPKGML